MTSTGSPTAAATFQRPAADALVRRLLRIPDVAPSGRGPDVHRAFSASILVSAVRCLFTYLFLPFVAPAVGFASGVGPTIGIPLGVVAVAANVASIRRFWLADHRWRWAYTGIGVAVMGLVLALIFIDVRGLVS